MKQNSDALKLYGAQVVPASPETGLHFILYPSCHIERESVQAVQRLIQAVKPDMVCPELCAERLQSLVHVRTELADPKTFLKKDVAEELKRQQRGDSPEGLEMALAVLEADRHKIPVRHVDRKASVTAARMQASVHDDAVLALVSPRVAAARDRLRLAYAIVPTRRGRAVPVTTLQQVMRSTLNFPWKWRQDLLKRAAWLDGMDVIPLDTLSHAIDAWKAQQERRAQLSIEDLKAEVLTGREPPMPSHYAAALGPETIHDAYLRVIGAERDVILAYNLRRESAHASGPLVFAPLGAAHIKGVSQHLQRPFADLEREATPLLVAPEVPWWKAKLLPMKRILRSFQLVSALPKLKPLSSPWHNPFEFAIA